MDVLTKEILESIRKDVQEIKQRLLGEGNNDGLVLDVDRLKKSRATTNAVLWVVFTAVVGAAATMLIR